MFGDGSRRIVIRAGVVLCLLALLGMVMAPMAGAHDRLTDSVPEDGARLDSAPTEVVLTFSGELATVGAVVQVADETGTAVTTSAPEVEGATVRQPVPADLSGGEYSVTWRVTSGDGHPISGTFGFTVADEAPGTADAAPTDEPTTAPTTAAPIPDSTSATTAAPAPDPTSAPTTDPAAASSEEEAEEPQGWVSTMWVGIGAAALILLIALTARRRS